MSFHTKVQISCARDYQQQTLSYNSLHVAGISQVMKHITKTRPQMVPITKLNFCLYPCYPSKKRGDIRYNRGDTHGFHEFYALFFARKQISILTLEQSVLLPCIRQQTKGEQSDEIEIRHSSFINSKPHEVKCIAFSLQI